MGSRFVVFFDDPKAGELTVDSLGGKGAQLVELSRLRYNVPRGFVVLSEAFDFFRSTHDELQQAGENEGESDSLQERIDARALPEPIARELSGALARAQFQSVAVRSSAGGEDSESRSFAGQFDTFLNVSPAVVPLVLKRCWTSLFNERARIYAKSQPGREAMAVVVQEMIDADVSGVAFTCHPVTGNRDILFVQTVRGLGEALVGGHVNPDTWEVTKSLCSVKTFTKGNQSKQWICAKAGGTTISELDKKGLTSAALSPELLMSLSDVCVDLEAVMEGACDIEWAIRDGQVFILQCRPVTTLLAK